MPFLFASSAMEGQNCSHMEGMQMDPGMLGVASSAMEVRSHGIYMLVTHYLCRFLWKCCNTGSWKNPLRGKTAHSDCTTETMTFYTTYFFCTFFLL